MRLASRIHFLSYNDISVIVTQSQGKLNDIPMHNTVDEYADTMPIFYVEYIRENSQLVFYKCHENVDTPENTSVLPFGFFPSCGQTSHRSTNTPLPPPKPKQ